MIVLRADDRDEPSAYRGGMNLIASIKNAVARFRSRPRTRFEPSLPFALPIW